MQMQSGGRLVERYLLGYASTTWWGKALFGAALTLIGTAFVILRMAEASSNGDPLTMRERIEIWVLLMAFVHGVSFLLTVQPGLKRPRFLAAAKEMLWSAAICLLLWLGAGFMILHARYALLREVYVGEYLHLQDGETLLEYQQKWVFGASDVAFWIQTAFCVFILAAGALWIVSRIPKRGGGARCSRGII